MRDLVRAREAANLDYKRNRQQVSSKVAPGEM
jgi:hypothetical protein